MNRHEKITLWSKRIEELISNEPDIHFEGVHPCSDGWDDCGTIRCGRSSGQVMLYVHPRDNPFFETELEHLIPHLRKREDGRIAEEKALESTVARYYSTE